MVCAENEEAVDQEHGDEVAEDNGDGGNDKSDDEAESRFVQSGDCR